MKKLCIILLLFLSPAVFSQTGVMRLEFEASINSDIYELVPLENQGLLVFFETIEKVGEDSKYWYFQLFGPSFEEVWKANIPVIEGARYQDFAVKDSLVYLFFLNDSRVKTGRNNFQLLTLDLKNQLSYESKGSLPSESSYVKFCVSGKKVFLGLNTRNDQASLFSIDPESSTVNEFQISYADENFLEDIVYDEITGHVLGLVSNYLSKKQNKFYLVALTADAGFSYDVEIQPVLTGKYLNAAKLTILDSAVYLLTGTYGNIASRIPSQNEYFGEESAGVFSTRITNRKQEFMNYYNFTEFRNLRAGVSARDYYRLQKKKDRESPEYSLNYELLLHTPEMIDSSVVLMMDAFYPEFRTVSDISYDYWGRPVTHTYSVFDGYRFFNSILTGFNFNGELMWDNSLEVNVAPTNHLDEKAACFFDGEPAILYYNDGSKISYRICLENTELEPFTRLELETTHTGDKITAVGRNYLTHWYGYNFLAFGYHTIQNNLLPDRNERTVFYINKIALE